MRLISLHMWETVCDAWACWSGWILVQILPEYPLFWSTVSEYPPPQMKIVRESKSESFRIPPQKWKLSESPNLRVSEYPPPKKNYNCQRVQIREFQNTPQKMKIVRESKYESFRIPPHIKIVRESKYESFRIPPHIKIVRESKSESFRIPPQWKL